MHDRELCLESRGLFKVVTSFRVRWPAKSLLLSSLQHSLVLQIEQDQFFLASARIAGDPSQRTGTIPEESRLRHWQREQDQLQVSVHLVRLEDSSETLTWLQRCSESLYWRGSWKTNRNFQESISISDLEWSYQEGTKHEQDSLPCSH